MECNIDSKGREVRVVAGLVVGLVGMVLMVLAATGGMTGVWPWAVGIAALLGGGFAMFEGWSGWCALRAMGFRTKI